MRGYAPVRFRIGKQENRIGRPACLEGSRLLEILAFEEKPRTRLRVERGARQHWCAIDLVFDARVSFADERQRQVHITAICPRLLQPRVLD
jgi:hypothetical protein